MDVVVVLLLQLQRKQIGEADSGLDTPAGEIAGGAAAGIWLHWIQHPSNDAKPPVRRASVLRPQDIAGVQRDDLLKPVKSKKKKKQYFRKPMWEYSINH